MRRAQSRTRARATRATHQDDEQRIAEREEDRGRGDQRVIGPEEDGAVTGGAFRADDCRGLYPAVIASRFNPIEALRSA
jgi:hypothetical protein